MGSSDIEPPRSIGLSQSGKLDLPEQVAEWKLEPELSFPIPLRAVLKVGSVLLLAIVSLFMWGGFFLFWKVWDVGGLFLCGWFAIGVSFSYSTRPRLSLSKSLVRRGTATRGTVTACKYRSSEHSDWTRCTIAYDAPARRFLTCNLGEGTKIGDTVTILYLPEAPDKAMRYKDCAYKAVVALEECR